MHGLFDSVFKEYNATQALYQQAAQNVLKTKDAAADKIAVAQIAKLQSLTPVAASVSSAPKPAPQVVSRQPVDYGRVALIGGVVLGLLVFALRR